MAKISNSKRAADFNKKYKVGSKIQYTDASGKEATGTLKHKAVNQVEQVSIWIEEADKKISLDKVISKY